MASWHTNAQGQVNPVSLQGQKTDLYFASLPLNWDQEEIKAFHQDLQADVSDIVAVKPLQPKRPGVNSRAAIVRYSSHAAALTALKLIQGGGSQLEVRFAEEKEKAPGKGNGKAWQASTGHSHQESGVPVKVGLRVRNSGNGQTGRVVACRGRTPGTFRVLFDNGQEWEWEVKRFQTEDGWPLLDKEMIPATVGMRVRCWMDGRCGKIAYIHNEWPQRVWVVFDDGDEGEKDATWFVSEVGCEPVGPGHRHTDWMYASGHSKGSAYTEHSWESWQSGKGAPGQGNTRQGNRQWEPDTRRDWKEGRPPLRQNQDQGKGSTSQKEENWQAKTSGKGSSRGGHTADSKLAYNARESSSTGGDLEERALREVIDQLLDESNAGRVWISNWPGRFQSKLGQLRDFLERHPDKFTVIPERGRRYTVAFSSSAPVAKATSHKSKQSNGLKWKVRPDGDAAGGTTAVGTGPGPRSTIRQSSDDATAFDAQDDHEESDEGEGIQ